MTKPTQEADIPPAYEQDDGPLTDEQMAKIRELSGFPEVTVSDIQTKEQQAAAQRFWLTMVDWAYHSGYVLCVAGGEPITTLSELENQWLRHTWDNTLDKHQQRRLVISKQPLA